MSLITFVKDENLLLMVLIPPCYIVTFTKGRVSSLSWFDPVNPVSYTHLDVYKRQTMYVREMYSQYFCYTRIKIIITA